MLLLLARLLYNVTIYPIVLALWRLRRRAAAREGAATLRLKRMPPLVSRRRLFRQTALIDLAEQLERAAADPLLRGLYVSLDGFHASAVDCHELAVLIDRFKRSGKRLHVFIRHVDWRSLIAARSADRVTTDPSGPVMVHGVGVEMPFLGELLERHGVRFQVLQRGDYKGAMEPLVRREPSAALVESLESLVDSLFERAAAEMARRPERDVERGRRALEEGPYTVTQAVERHLVDAAEEDEEAEDALAAACGSPPPSTPERETRQDASISRGATPGRPLRRLPHLRRAGFIRPGALSLTRSARFAFVPVVGLIVDRQPGIGTRQAAVATELVPRVRGLADARGVEAIVLAIDSRGGTATASEAIWSAARYAMAKKPVIAWMRTYAASGGYYVAAAAERIIASPFTITGSIGVVSAHPNVSEAAARLGVRTFAVTRGRGALLSSPFRPLEGSDLEWMEAHIGESYDRFKSIVAEGRRMSIEAVEDVARGRIWTAPQACERGLVDTIGSLADVIAAARELAGLSADTPHEVSWVAPREGFLQAARWLTRPSAADAIVPELEELLEPLVLARSGRALFYMPTLGQNSEFGIRNWE
jgi:protease-4